MCILRSQDLEEMAALKLLISSKSITAVTTSTSVTEN